MSILLVRRISQVFFLLLFLWFCVAMTFGTEWWQLRGWPVNLLLDLDPLVAIGTLLTTHRLYAGLSWALLTIAVTIVFGRVFCGWVCPFGTLHQVFGWIATRTLKPRGKMDANRYRKGQVIKYYVLIAFLAMAAFPFGSGSTLVTGLLDPIPLAHRSVNLALLPIAGSMGSTVGGGARHYEGAWVVGAVFVAALLMNFVIPRFFCRFICPTGALLGLLSRFAVFRIAKVGPGCTQCDLCESHCEGAADPAMKLRLSECLMCMNCIKGFCSKNLITYRAKPSVEPDLPAPDLGRRAVLASFATGFLAVPAIRTGATLGANYHPRTIRPPGSLAEEEFLQRCIKCGQCMRVCPTNIIMPAGIDGGIENLWTPVLNFRIGTSGCQLNCTACGHVCPTAAIRPISLEEKQGRGKYHDAGPIRMGTAFVDRGRCLPWAMGTPCIVCEENCPVTPKAIYVRESFEPVRGALRKVVAAENAVVTLGGHRMHPGQFASGDYHLASADNGGRRIRISANTENTVTLAGEGGFSAGEMVRVEVRLQAPCVDVDHCIGCGVCEHECPVSGLRAIRVSAENETRNKRNSLRLKRGES
ncbi:MAG: 4Fe-4S binding protein [Candidatus Sumerlaeaceae bacterium]|nr:4Fe-4S binding protein [Candidatus Sumerlaeaceae bacterium]